MSGWLLVGKCSFHLWVIHGADVIAPRAAPSPTKDTRENQETMATSEEKNLVVILLNVYYVMWFVGFL